MSKMGIAAVVLAIAAGAANYIYARTLEQNTTGGVKIGVLVVARDMKQGDVLDENSMSFREIPAAYVDERDVTEKHKSEVMDAPVQVALKKGQVLQWTDFQSRIGDAKKDLADLVEPGKRAMTIVVNRKSALGGLLRPGHRVDILGTFISRSMGDNNSKQRSQVLLQNVIVLATGKQLSLAETESGFNTVTLSVTIEQSELLSFAGELGTLSLVLRGYSDLAVTEAIPKKGYDDLFSAAPNSAIPRDKLSPAHIERLSVKK